MSLSLLETSLYVDDLARSESFYTRLLDARVVLSEERMRALRLPDDWILLLFARGLSQNGEETPGGKIPGHDARGAQHLCFSVAPEDLDAYAARLDAVESEVKPSQGGRSIYGRDPDGHSIEFADRAIWDALPPLGTQS